MPGSYSLLNHNQIANHWGLAATFVNEEIKGEVILIKVLLWDRTGNHTFFVCIHAQKDWTYGTAPQYCFYHFDERSKILWMLLFSTMCKSTYCI